MSPDLRWVFDTNAIVSAMLFKASVPRSAFREARRCGQILVSEATVAELTAVLKRDKFNRYLTSEERQQFLAQLIEQPRKGDADRFSDFFFARPLSEKAAAVQSHD